MISFRSLVALFICIGGAFGSEKVLMRSYKKKTLSNQRSEHGAMITGNAEMQIAETRPSETKDSDLSTKIGDMLTYEEIPVHLQKLGETLLGSPNKVKDLMKDMSPIQLVNVGSMPLRMVSSRQDDTVPRLNNEMKGDAYGASKISEKDGIIVDVGSNIGDMAIHSAILHPQMQIVALEPVPPTFFFLRINLWLNNVPELDENDFHQRSKPGVLALNRAVTADGRQVEIRWNDAKSQNAVADSHSDNTVGWSKAMIPSIVFPEFMKSQGIHSIRLFKIDCEGCEFEVIPAMQELFKDKHVLERVAGEIHQSLKSTKGTIFAAKPAADKIKATDEALASRGCQVGQWQVRC